MQEVQLIRKLPPRRAYQGNHETNIPSPVLPTLGRLFRPDRQKNVAAEEKIRPPSKFPVSKAF
jgi:hypothetical protein